jgi:hypothetical protein
MSFDFEPSSLSFPSYYTPLVELGRLARLVKGY